jgi:bifunctional non-homologous end joining protein LigD
MRPDRVLYPDSGFTKRDALSYYRRAAQWLLPHLKNVPVSFKRYPDTIGGESFWEKDAPSFTPKWVKTVDVPRRSGPPIHYVVINDLKTLTWLVDAGAIEIHPFLHRAPKLDVATSVVFDLDPGEGASIDDCCDVALLLRDSLANVKLKSFAKSSGSKGLQVYVPLNASATHDSTEAFAKLVAEEIARAVPKRVTAKMPKQYRARKVFIDWSQNADYKTTVAVYSLRAKSDPPFVSIPVTWNEVAKRKNLYLAPDAALRRLASKGDLFAPVLKLKQTLPITSAAKKRAPVAADDDEQGWIAKPRSQSGRRLFLVVRTDQAGDELWLDMLGKFKRWILRPDREAESRLIAMPAGQFAIEEEYYRGVVPAKWKRRVKIEDAGVYELIEGSYARRRFDLWFTGRALDGEWILEKISEDEAHRSWSLRPAR